MEVVQVQPRDSYLHYIHVPSKGTVIRWSFTTKRNNISFGLYRRRGKDPLPNSSDITFRAQLQKRQFSSGDFALHQDEDEDIESTYGIHSSNQSIHSTHSSRPRAKSVASAKLKEGGLDEIIPIQHTQSRDHKVEGHYTVDEPGNYVLVFDNTYSRNTPKMLTYSVALGDSQSVQLKKPGEISGWILKKKRKRMQGWAKRWFTLSPSGVLSYSTSQNGITRGSIQILVSTISYNAKLRQFHIDSGTMIYHLKTLTEQDYSTWSTALREFRSSSSVENNNNDDVKTTENGDDSFLSLNDNDLRHQIKRLSSRSIMSNPTSSLQHEKRLMAQVDQGIQLSTQLQDISSQLMIKVMQLKQLLSENNNNNNPQVQQLMDQIESEKALLLSNTDEQLFQWQSVQASLSSHRRSATAGSITPQRVMIDSSNVINEHQQQQLQEEDDQNNLSSPFKAISIHSRLSGYSEQFFDAEDILLSDEEDHEHFIINNESSDDEESGENDSQSVLNLESMSACDRRSKLPSPAVADAGSALAVFRKNVGKDLSTISMPISMNEPLNMLQRACEELEYCDLLAKASHLSDPFERLMYVTVFSISTYASTQYRTGRKPFNPMMTETYESIRPDRGFRFISEKVSHNPLIIAAHAEAKEFKYWQSTEIKSKFWGKSMEFMTEGSFHVTLTGHDDHFTFYKPSSWMKNMIAGERYLEHSGECKIQNHTTGDYAMVTFKEGTGGGLFGAPTKRNDVIATIYNSNGKKIRRVVGKWSERLAEEVHMDKSKLEVLWTAKPPGIEHHEKYFGLTKFATELNELTVLEKDKLPITDTRFRPDQCLYEKGLVDEADEEKRRIEQKQRDRRKQFELQGTTWSPRWFKREGDEWQYAGQYWQARETGQWPQDLFSLW